MDLDALLEAGMEAAAAAGAVLCDGRRQGFEVATKSTSTDMVTAMDRAAEGTIASVLAKLRPDDSVTGEEGTARRGTSGVLWLVDPLDGTTNYLYDLPAWSVSIAAEFQGTVVVGVVFDPSHGETFTATRGRGAWLLAAPDEPRRLQRGAPPQGGLDLSTALVGTGFSYAAAARARQAAVLTRVLPRVRDIRRMGSAALDLCAVAAGRLDAYYESGTHPWDHAAGALIAAEAGCWVGGLGDEPLSTRMVATAAPEITDTFRRLLEDAEAAVPAATDPASTG